MKRTYSKEFKIEACRLVIKDGIKPSVVAEKMGINMVMLYARLHTNPSDWIEKSKSFDLLFSCLSCSKKNW